MLGRKPVSTRAVAAILAAVAVFGGCRDKATTGPTRSQLKDFATALRLVSGDQQTGPVGAALQQQIVVKVVDAGGQPVEGATVTFQVRGGGGSINPPANTSSSSGLVTATWTLGTSLGANKAVAILTNNYVLDSTSVTATALHGPPALFSIVAGNNQKGKAGNALGAPLVVKLLDQFGYAVSGAKVTWTPGVFGGSVAVASDTSGADGTASAAWTLGTSAVPQTMSASVGILTPLVFSATAAADTGRTLIPITGSGQTASVGTTLPTAISLKVTDQFGNPIAGETITWGDSIAGGGSILPVKSTTDNTGMASAQWTLGNLAGAQLVRSKSSSGATTSFTASGTVAFSDVQSGNFQACATATTNNRVYCWGLGDAGQLAKGENISNSSAPSVAVSIGGDTLRGPFLQVRQVFAGSGYFCALSPSRAMYCWGKVLGSGSVSKTASFQNITDGSATVIPNFLANGLEHQCIMTPSGTAFCTGYGRDGQIGSGVATSTAANTYAAVVAPPSFYSAISAGRAFNCGMPRYNPGVATSQIPSCWGYNGDGQLGTGDFLNKLVPTAVTMPALVTAFDSASLSAGAQHACAMTPAGAGYCWGSNAFGQLGKGVAGTRDSIPQLVAAPAGVVFARMYAGESHTCAIDATGDAYCWGRNDYGQLGNGAPSAFGSGVPSPVLVGGGLKFRSLSLGELFTCGVVAALGTATGPSPLPGTVYCWGDNSYGQIGNGAQGTGGSMVLTPTKVLFQP